MSSVELLNQFCKGYVSYVLITLENICIDWKDLQVGACLKLIGLLMPAFADTTPFPVSYALISMNVLHYLLPFLYIHL